MPTSDARHQTDLKLEYVSGRTLLPADYNPRLLKPSKRAKLKNSLRLHGFVDPAIARVEDKLLIGGHQRVDVWINDLGGDLVPVVYLTGVSDEQAKALNVALNNPELQGEFDMLKLKELLTSLDSVEFDMTLTGYDDAQVVSILNWEPPKLVPDAAPRGQPQLKSERLIEIRGTDESLRELFDLLGPYAEKPGIVITIT